MIALLLSCLWLTSALANHHHDIPPTTRIVGGLPAGRGQIPFQVSVRDRRDANFYNHVCGGVIVSFQEIITAAHCVSSIPVQSLYIVAGTTRLPLENFGGVAVDASSIKIHPFFEPQKYGNDIAIIKLAKRLPENRNDIQPAVLLRDLPRAGVNCTVSGWGDVNGTTYSPVVSLDLRFAQVSYVPNSQCKTTNAFVQDDAVCAAPQDARRKAGPCTLDSGGPLECGGGLLGVYSWSDGCGTADHPGVYTSVPFHFKWIRSGQTMPANVPLVNIASGIIIITAFFFRQSDLYVRM